MSNDIATTTRPCPGCGLDMPLEIASGQDYEYRTCSNTFHFVRCGACALAYLNPMPLPSQLGEVYPAEYKPFHFSSASTSLITGVRNAIERRRVARYLELLPRDARILDVGCGDGRHLGILGDVNPAWRLEGLDFNPLAVERVRSQGLRAHAGGYAEVELVPGHYDLLIMNQVIEHFPDPAATLRKAWGELRPNGLLNLETPSLEGWDAKLFHSGLWGGYHFPRHLTLFTAETLRALLRNNGFEVVSVTYMLSPVFWVFSWHHWWERHVGRGACFFSDTNPLALAAATCLDLLQKGLRGKTTNMRVLARKQEAP